ncbi:hypothetical protein AMECASPLE_010820 [Ameca splendens]|uniref:Uncharacterized protein n=1 Tax=Ameca splendens TaxID=208324 RepID=A0ABV0YNE5_9TELE
MTFCREFLLEKQTGHTYCPFPFFSMKGCGHSPTESFAFKNHISLDTAVKAAVHSHNFCECNSNTQNTTATREGMTTSAYLHICQSCVRKLEQSLNTFCSLTEVTVVRTSTGVTYDHNT